MTAIAAVMAPMPEAKQWAARAPSSSAITADSSSVDGFRIRV